MAPIGPPWEGQKGTKILFFQKFDFEIVNNLQKGPFTVKLVKIGQKIGFGPIWTPLDPLGEAKWGLKIKFSKI